MTRRTSSGLSWDISRGLSWGISWFLGLASFLALLGASLYLFYFRGYVSILSGDSSSFLIELARTQARNHTDADVLVLGNSTAAEGFLVNYFNSHAPGHTALNLGVPSGNVFLFDRMTAMAVREGVRPKSIVLMLMPDIFSRREGFNFLRNDLTLLKTVLSAQDVATLGIYAQDLREYADLAVPIALRPVLFRAELKDFLAHPGERLENSEKVRGYLAGFHKDTPMPESDHPFAVCEAGPLDQLDATVERLRREKNPALPDVERVLAGYNAMKYQPSAVDSFRVERIHRLLERLRGTGAQVYIAEAPFYDPNFTQYPAAYRDAFKDALKGVAQSVPGVTLLPTFEGDCTMMMDTLHLNRKGGELFTEYLRTRVL
ncbi:MAG: hypothetical protein ABL995_08055 [Bryobacteraceae bacterium]